MLRSTNDHSAHMADALAAARYDLSAVRRVLQSTDSDTIKLARIAGIMAGAE